MLVSTSLKREDEEEKQIKTESEKLKKEFEMSIPRLYDERLLKRMSKKREEKSANMKITRAEYDLPSLKSEVNTDILDSLILKDIRRKASLIAKYQREKDNAGNDRPLNLFMLGKVRRSRKELINQEKGNNPKIEEQKAIQESQIIKKWIEDEKGSVIFDVYQKKRDNFKTLIGSAFIAKGSQLHSRILNKIHHEIEEKEKDNNLMGVLSEGGITKTINELRERYWKEEFRFFNKVRMIELLESRTKTLENQLMEITLKLKPEKGENQNVIFQRIQRTFTQETQMKNQNQKESETEQYMVLLTRLRSEVISLGKSKECLKAQLLLECINQTNNLDRLLYHMFTQPKRPKLYHYLRVDT